MDRNYKLINKALKERVRQATQPHERLKLQFDLVKSVYGIRQKELAMKAWGLDPTNASLLLAGKKSLDATYESYADKLGAYMIDNLLIAKKPLD